MWSDGAPTQFKSKTAWYLRTQSPVPTVHNYFGAGHGKGEHDGAGANIKHQVAVAIMSTTNAHRLLNPHDYYEYCKEHLGTPVDHVHPSHNVKVQLSSREFYWVADGTVVRNNDKHSSVASGSCIAIGRQVLMLARWWRGASHAIAHHAMLLTGMHACM